MISKYMKLCYLLLAAAAEPLMTLWRSRFVHELINSLQFVVDGEVVILCATTVALAAFAIVYYIASRPRLVYLVDYSCFKPPATGRVPFAAFVEHLRHIPSFDDRSVRFQTRIIERSGLGEETCLPAANHYIPPSTTLEASRSEARLVVFSAIDSLIAKTGIDPVADVDVLVVNCSLFSPTPSLSAAVVEQYKLRHDVRTFNLSGMGCSAGLVSIGLERDLLQVHPRCNVLVVSTEIITPNFYTGNQRSMLLPNCIFHMGGAAMLLSNRRHEYAARAKYHLVRVVRTNKGAGDDDAYRCVYEEEDSDGISGISLSKDLMSIAGEALRSNITAVGQLVLPASEQLLFLATLVGRRVLGRSRWKPYVPDFKLAFEHFCIHAGGRAVIDELQRKLGLSAEHVEASRMTLHRFGNTSSSSLWYELSYIESKGRMKRGHRIWQIDFGSGFKCNSAVWKCLRTMHSPASVEHGPWDDCIHRYPVHIPDLVKL